MHSLMDRKLRGDHVGFTEKTQNEMDEWDSGLHYLRDPRTGTAADLRSMGISLRKWIDNETVICSNTVLKCHTAVITGHNL
jgi:hypothetical protein